MSRRVVVTGMGAISPIGNDVPTMWKNMVDGVCGIETITAFDTSDLKVHIAGTVKDFDPTQLRIQWAWKTEARERFLLFSFR